jgi:predicted lipid-binding transport protein (Tim44 family)
VGIFLGIALIVVGATFIVSREQMKRGLQKQPSDAPEPAADRALAAPGRWMVASRLRTGLVGGLFMAFGLFLIVVIPT